MSSKVVELGPERETRTFERFSLSQRIEHLLMIVSFTSLMLTGIPQKFNEAGWAQWMLSALGGIEFVRQIHHFFAVLFILESVYHLLYVVYVAAIKRGRLHMLPELADVREALHSVLYLLGRMKTPPRHSRYDFRQKFEYWGVVWGSAVMVITGAIIWFPVAASRILPGEFIPAAKAAHGGEALLALFVIVVWHFYGAHFNQHAFPFDTSIFTGKISEKRMIEEHPREYEQIVRAELTEEESAPSSELEAVTNEPPVAEVRKVS